MRGPLGYMEGASPFHRMDGLGKLLSLLMLVAAVILTDRWEGFLLLGAVLYLAYHFSHLPPRAVWGGLRPLRLFFLLILLLNFAFFDTENAFCSWWIFSFSWEGLRFGAVTVMRIVLAVAAGSLFVAVTTPLGITDAMESLLWPLQWIGVPVRDVAMILGTALQFVPLLEREAEEIRMAQTARGAAYGSGRTWRRAFTFLPLVVPVFLTAFQRADELSLAMESRGYERRKGRLPWRKRRFRPADIGCLCVCAALCAAAAIWF